MTERLDKTGALLSVKDKDEVCVKLRFSRGEPIDPLTSSSTISFPLLS